MDPLDVGGADTSDTKDVVVDEGSPQPIGVHTRAEIAALCEVSARFWNYLRKFGKLAEGRQIREMMQLTGMSAFDIRRAIGFHMFCGDPLPTDDGSTDSPGAAEFGEVDIESANILWVAERLDTSSRGGFRLPPTRRAKALLEFAKADPKAFWTTHYAKVAAARINTPLTNPASADSGLLAEIDRLEQHALQAKIASGETA